MKASTVAEVMAGENSWSGTPTEQFAGLLGIASVISNRQKYTGQTINNVVEDQSQFNAFGNELPPGVGPKHIEMAAKAMSYVEKNGPLTTAKYYATPKTVQGLPKGLKSVETIGAHQFFDDPQNRPIQTKVGAFSIPEAVQHTIQAVDQAKDRVVGALKSVPAAVGAMAKVGFHLGAHRPNMPNQGIVDAAAKAVGGVVPGGNIDVTSGQGQYGSHRHRVGQAVDMDVNDDQGRSLFGSAYVDNPGQARTKSRVSFDKSTGSLVTANPSPRNAPLGSLTADPGFTRAQDVGMSFAAQNPQGGVGYGPGYMAPGKMHLDIAGPGVTWGKEGKAKNAVPSFRQNVENARTLGRFADEANATRPGMPVGQLPGPSTPAVTRSPLGAAQDNPANTTAGLSRNAFDTQKAKPQQGPPASAMREGRVTSPAAPMGSRVTSAPDPARFGPSTTATPATAAPDPARFSPGVQPGIGMAGAVISPAISGQKMATAAPPSYDPLGSIQAPKPATKVAYDPLSSVAAPLGTPDALTTAAQQLATAPPMPPAVNVPQRVVAQVKPAQVAPTIAAPVQGPPISAMPEKPTGFLDRIGKAFAHPADPLSTRNVGTGMAALQGIRDGTGVPGDTAYSRSTPGFSQTALPGGGYMTTNQYGHKSYKSGAPTGGFFGAAKQGFGSFFDGLGGFADFGKSLSKAAGGLGGGGKSSSKSSGGGGKKSSSGGGNSSNSRSSSAGY